MRWLREGWEDWGEEILTAVATLAIVFATVVSLTVGAWALYGFVPWLWETLP